MIKMFIGNEEVVSNHEFSIKEEMLSASSTILNNCYPKSWELTKDYVSNFYYPKDYSKFILASGEFEHGDTEYSILDVSGNQPQFETNVEKEWNSLNIYGKTEQETAPEEWDKNFLYLGDLSTEPPSLTITKLSNSSIRIDGTAAGDTTLEYSLLYDKKLDNNSYTFSTRIDLPLESEINVGLTSMTEFNSMTIPINAPYKYETSNANNGKVLTKLVINIPRDTVFNNTVLQFQLEQGTSMTSFTPATYTPGMPSPYKISKLNSVGYENIINFADREYKITNYYYRDFGTGILITEDMVGKVISFSYDVKISDYSGSQTTFVGVIGRSTNNNAMQNNIKTSGYLPMPNELTKIKIENITIPDYVGQYLIIRPVGFASLSTANIEVSNVQITYGGTSLSYIPYGKYGIEVKTIGKNLFDKNSYQNLSTNYEYNIASYHIRKIQLEPNTNYTVSHNAPSSSNVVILINNIQQVNGTNYYDLRNASGTKTITTDSTGCLYIGVVITFTNEQYNDRINECNVQIEKGNTATTYEAYKENSQLYTLDEPLRSIGDTKDLLYIRNGMLYVERKIGCTILNSEWAWFKSGTSAIDRYGISNSYFGNVTSMSSTTTKSNYFVYNVGAIIGTYSISGTNVYFDYSTYNTSTVNDFKAWLSTHNTEVDYVLAEPYTEEIGQVQMPYSFEGINNILLNIGAVDTIIDVYYYWKNYDVIFAGIVKNSGEISLNPRHPHYCSLQILDYKTFLSESDTLDYVISNKTIREAIEMVVDTVSDYGFSVGTIDISSADDVIGAYSTLNKTAYDVLQYLADISGSRWRARYIDNSSMAIDFYEPDTLPQVDDIEYTQEYWENNNIVDLTFNYGTRDYRNKQIVLSDEVYAGIDYNEIILSNGYNTNFITSQNVGVVKEIIINGVKKDVITQQEKDLGADADFYYTPGKNIIESSSSYTAGTPIAVVYTPLVKGRQIVFNNDEVGRIATQTDTIGVISRYESRNDVVSSAELERIGETYIEYKGKAEIILTLTTHNKDLFNIGEVAYFNSPIDELKQKYMVKSKETQYIIESETGAINLFYVYELTSSFNSEKAINYFDNQRNKAQGNIQEGESITRNIDINSSAVIVWGNSSIEETTISVVGDNVLNSVLNSPFIE